MNLKGRTIGILEYPHCSDRDKWTIRMLQGVWQQAGAKVLCHSDFSGPAPEVDVWFCHLASTRRTAQAERFIRRQSRVVNGALSDIRKSSFSEQMLNSGDASYTGQVIVKSDYNFKGLVDKRLADHRPGWKRLIPRGLRRKLVGLPSNFRIMEDYKVYDSIRDVPLEYMKDETVAVEKFRPERDGDHYVLRMMFKLGDQALSCRMVSTDQIVKSGNAMTIEETENDPRVMAWANARKVDFGKIDYVEIDGELVFFDINSTPSSSGLEEQDQYVANVIASGILPFME